MAEFGDASANLELNKAINGGLSKAEKLSLPITFLVLLIAFGAFVAAGLPVLLAFSAVLGAGGLAAAGSHVFHASDATSSVMLLMGMAVGVDYSLFYLKREREERRAGHADSLQRAAATSGRAVLASGLTVLIAMAGMLLSGTKVFDSIGIGAMLVVAMAMVGSLTVLPALLGKLGDRVDKGRIRAPAHDVASLERRAGAGDALPVRCRGAVGGRARRPGPARPAAAHHAGRPERHAQEHGRSCRPTTGSRARSRARRRPPRWCCAARMSTPREPGPRSAG